MMSGAALEAVTAHELSRASSLFGTLKQLRLKLKNADEAALDRAFESHVQGVLDKLDSRLPGLDDKPLRTVEITMAKHGLYDAAFQQVILLCQNISPALGDCVKELRKIHSGFLSDLQQSFYDLTSENDKLMDEIGVGFDECAQLQNDNGLLQDAMSKLNAEAEIHQAKVLELRRHLREAAQEINYLREALSSDSKRGNIGNALTFDTTKSPAKPFSSFENIKSPNGGKFGPGLSSTQTAAESVSGSQVSTPRYASPLKRSDSNSKGNYFFNNTANSYNTTLTKSSPMHNYLDNTSQSDAASSVAGTRSFAESSMQNNVPRSLALASPTNWLHIFRQDVQRAMDAGKCREITKKECTEIIEKLYASKTIANEKALKGIGNIPMETMEQHAYRSMEKRYGLRSLAVEHAGMLVKALEVYSADDNDILVFYKIFRNELEENFRLIQEELNRSIKDLTMVQLMGRYPTKDQPTLQTMLDQKIGEGFIYEEEWKDMTSYLYNAADSTTLSMILRKMAIKEKGDSYNDPENALTQVNTNSMTKIRKANSAYVMGAGHNNGLEKGYSKQNTKDIRRLGYSSATLQVEAKEPVIKVKKEILRLPFQVFLRTVLDFQLQSHCRFLENFVKIFRDMDKDVDGVINAAEFQQCFIIVRRQSIARNAKSGEDEDADEDMIPESDVDDTFLTMIKEIDPMQTDRVTFSSAVTQLSKL